jgi:eukaryotic-like serine/threonine-protein kinase
MNTIGSLTLCIQNLRSPDVQARDEAARVIWERFAARLQALARRHLDNRIRRREDEQDILQSMYASFCIGQREGNASPASREELWRLLVRITLCKVVNTAKRNFAVRRDVRREHSPSPTLFPLWMLDHVDRAQVDPAERLIVLEELDRLLQELPEKLRQIVVWKVEGFTNAEIAHHLKCTVRSIELKMQLTRKRLGMVSRPSRPITEDEPPA